MPKHHPSFLSAFIFCLCGAISLGTKAESQTINQSPANEKEWNLLVYINGVNNLDSFGAMNINQMEEVGTNSKMNIIVQWGSLSKPNVERLLIAQDKNKSKVTSPVLQSLGPADMGDYRSLVDFVRWSHQNFPAKKYFIVVWNHGGGWHLNSILKASSGFSPQDISWDDRSGNFITTEQLGLAMQESAQIIGHKVDIYGSDACLMGMIEVAAEMQDSVSYFVGSQDLEPGEGWPYSSFLKAWNNQNLQQPADVAKLISKEYLAAYNGGIYGNQDVTMSAYDLSKISNYYSAIKNFVQELGSLPNSDIAKLKSAGKSSKMFTYSDYRDSLDFFNKAEKANVRSRFYQDIQQAHSQFVISNDQNQDSRTFGMSFWLPQNKADFDAYWGRYQKLRFHQETGWKGL